MRPFTQVEAIELLDQAFNVAPDNDSATSVEAFVAGISDDRAVQDVKSYIALMSADIDADCIDIKPDSMDGSDMECVYIKITVEG
jgi:hypothetical protein